jgi:hypothetical protein
MAIRWQFVERAEDRDVAWTWRVLFADGTITVSSHSFASYGIAVHDAIRHGFLPSEHDWAVVSSAGTARFHCGNDPVMVTGGASPSRPRRRKLQWTRESEPPSRQRVPPKRHAGGKRPGK